MGHEQKSAKTFDSYLAIHEPERRCADYTFSLDIVCTQAMLALALSPNYLNYP